MPLRPLAALLLIVGGWAACQRARAVDWSETAVDLEATPERTELRHSFTFVNRTGRTVHILSIQSSCPCLCAASASTTVEPGKSGRIEALFQTGTQTGRVERKLVVATDEPGGSPQSLIVRVAIQPYVKVTPEFFYWRMGGDPSEKVVDVAAGTGRAISVLAVTSNLPEVSIRVEDVAKGRLTRIHLLSTPRPDHATAALQIEVSVEGVGRFTKEAYGYYR